MRPSLEALLHARHPTVFAAGRGCQHADGWFALVDALATVLAGRGVEAAQVKEKFGELRFYTAADPGDFGSGAIQAATAYSRAVCEETGLPGMTMRRRGYYRTVSPASPWYAAGQAPERFPDRSHLVAGGADMEAATLAATRPEDGLSKGGRRTLSTASPGWCADLPVGYRDLGLALLSCLGSLSSAGPGRPVPHLQAMRWSAGDGLSAVVGWPETGDWSRCQDEFAGALAFANVMLPGVDPATGTCGVGDDGRPAWGSRAGH
ncbi:hypothetical protein [Roseomonas gilardii]|uniref:hypothetical protein n=1 Tax=Roseomonas gilardii TaxID=257708 RepID=UPI0004885E8D|nr:hypothetical protein [Roseomonas gilardii]SUE63181.1 Uncharacterised protein [Roseomonas gilardii subsp. rosea]